MHNTAWFSVTTQHSLPQLLIYFEYSHACWTMWLRNHLLTLEPKPSFSRLPWCPASHASTNSSTNTWVPCGRWLKRSLRLSHLIFPFVQPRRASISQPVATITLWMVAVLTQLCSTCACVVADAAQVSSGWNDPTATNQPQTFTITSPPACIDTTIQPVTFQVQFGTFKDLNACIIRKLPFKIFDNESFRELANTALRKCVCLIPSVT